MGLQLTFCGAIWIDQILLIVNIWRPVLVLLLAGCHSVVHGAANLPQLDSEPQLERVGRGTTGGRLLSRISCRLCADFFWDSCENHLRSPMP